MPATVTTTETFPPSTPKSEIDEEIRLRLKAGAITSKIDKTAPKWTLETVWNVFGEQ